MKTLLKSALILDPASVLHGKRRDILIQNGKITELASDIDESNVKTIASKGLCVSPGWIDLKANFCEPGFEFKENLRSGIDAATRGGFKSVVLMPSTLPVVDGKSGIEFVQMRTSKSAVRILQTGALSEKMEGKQLSEMFDMFSAGAIAFTDDKNNVSTELMSRALEYSKNFGGLVMSFPYDRGVSSHGQINEGNASVSLGMKGIPNVSEEMRIQRDIELLRYHGGRLHFNLISTSRSVDMIRKAKREGLNVTCAIAAHQLSFLDEDLKTFDTNLKVLPPFRTREDRKALIQGLKDNTIDAICSDHTPEDVEHKVREFEDASFGVSGIETAFCSAWSALEKSMSIDEVIAKFTAGPAMVLGETLGGISVGYDKGITVFSTDENTLFSKETWKSKSSNNPFITKELRGRVYL
jgi:dihydroorotase